MKKRSIVRDSFKVGFGMALGYAAGKMALQLLDGIGQGMIDGLKIVNEKNEEPEADENNE